MKILLLQLKRIGDLIVTIPAIRALRKEFPDAHITLVISKECQALIPVMPDIQQILITGRNISDLGTFCVIAQSKFDCCIDFTQNDRSAFLTLLSGATKRVASDPIRRSKIRARIYNEFVPHRMRDMQTVDYNLTLLAPLGILNAARSLRLELPGAALEKADALRREAKIDSSFVIFHPGSARPDKFWEADRWAELIDHAQSKSQIHCVISGGISKLEQEHIRAIKSKLRRPVVDLSGKTDLLTLAALIARARLLVTVDSAPMHLAAATGTPQVILFGPTNPFHWRPLESRSSILQGDAPIPLVEFSPHHPPAAMNQISTQTTIDAMESLLSNPDNGRARPPDVSSQQAL